MKYKKDSLSKIVKKHLYEMAMDFDTPDRPHPEIQQKLAGGDTPLQKVPLPKTGEEPNKNFQELLASDRYRQIVQRIREYTGLQPNTTVQTPETANALTMMAMDALPRIAQIEAAHHEELEKLAVEMVKKEMGIPEGAVQFDVKIEEPNLEGFQKDQEQIENNPPEVNTEIEVNIATNLEKLNLERAKRRLINAMIQGSSAKGHYMYHYVAPELIRITGSEHLINLYGILMSVVDLGYWQFPDEMIQGAMEGAVGGKEEVKRETEPPTIVARGVNFPTLVHEIIKGLMELFSHQGEPEDKEMFQQVMELEDTMEKEIWDMRLGPSIWERIRKQFPEEVLVDETKTELQNWILVEIFKLDAKQFLVLTKELLEGTEKGKRLMNSIYHSVLDIVNNRAYEEATEQFHNDLQEVADTTPDEDINEFLNDLTDQGIGRAGEERPVERPAENMTDAKLSGMGLNALNVEMNKAIDAGNWELAQRIQKMIERKEGHPR